MENWRAVVGYEGFYEVSDSGLVRSVDRLSHSLKRGVQRIKGRMLKPGIASNGYPSVALCRDGKPRTHNVHAMVAEAFIGPRPEGKVIDHIDQDRANPKVGNLRYVSQATNMQNTRTTWSRSGRKGVYPGNGAWIAQIRLGGKMVHLGSFATIAEAASAREARELQVGWGQG